MNQRKFADMQTQFDTSFEQRLASIDLTAVMAHVAEDHGITGADAARAEDLYRKFLTLVARHPGEFMVPPVVVDHVWHAHITFTRQYMADCDKLFGAYLHHTPSSEDLSEQFRTGTLAYMAAEFGEHLTGLEACAGGCGA